MVQELTTGPGKVTVTSRVTGNLGTARLFKTTLHVAVLLIAAKGNFLYVDGSIAPPGRVQITKEEGGIELEIGNSSRMSCHLAWNGYNPRSAIAWLRATEQ